MDGLCLSEGGSERSQNHVAGQTVQVWKVWDSVSKHSRPKEAGKICPWRNELLTRRGPPPTEHIRQQRARHADNNLLPAVPQNRPLRYEAHYLSPRQRILENHISISKRKEFEKSCENCSGRAISNNEK